jgi:two-component system phosphate regulon response regulator OmpR
VLSDNADMTLTEPPLILIVDDDVRLRELLARYLETHGYRVAAVANLAGLRLTLAQRHVDLIVLDLMLPDGDGIDACRRLRGEHVTTPVLMLTARGDEVDRIVGLEIGADDYLPKPCAPRELLARIRAILRRTAPLPGAAPREHGERLRFGGFEFDTRTRQLSRAGEPIKLTSGEFAVLAALAAQAGKPMSRDQLMNIARGLDHDAGDRSIDVMVSRIRRLIEHDARRPRFLQTVWGVGYVFVVDGNKT